MKLYKNLIYACVMFLLILGFKITAFGSSINTSNQDYDVENRQERVKQYYDDFFEDSHMDRLSDELSRINQQYGRNYDIDFDEIYELLIHGKMDEAISIVIQSIYTSIGDEIIDNREIIIKLLVLVVIAGIFRNYSSVFNFSYIGEQGFFATYLMIAILLMQSFTLIYNVAEETIMYIKDIMLCLMPAFYMSIVLCSGLTTSQMVNSMFLGMLTFLEKLLLNVILPGIRIFFLIIVLNQMNQKDRFSKLAGLIKQAVGFVLKAVVAGIIGLNMMKSILLPIYDNAKYNVLQKGLAAVPGGASLSGLSSILVGASVLIKNSLGLSVVIVLLVFSSIPILKIFCFFVVYKVILAFIQPISDSRILAGIQGTIDSIGMLLRAITTSIVLSILSIAIILLTTNVRLYAG